jgi:hypothetical protein
VVSAHESHKGLLGRHVMIHILVCLQYGMSDSMCVTQTTPSIIPDGKTQFPSVMKRGWKDRA